MLSVADYIVIAIYGVVLLAVALFVSRQKAGHEMSGQDYFLAGKSLPWWAIGASLIAANISAEQIIGQSGQGYVVGLAIAAYEWQAAIVLLVVAKYFLPIFLDKKIYTMPQFLELRFGSNIKLIMAVFWVVLYTAVNLTAVLWLGALAVQTLTGFDTVTAMVALAAFALAYSLYGGLKAVALTDIIQVAILIAGGVAITLMTLQMIGGDDGALSGLNTLYTTVESHFHMILPNDHSSYQNLPGIWTLAGGLWVLHFSYWGFNQYIIQRALGAENLGEAQKGLVFAAGLKLMIPLIVVVPGIAAFWLAQNGQLDKALLDATPDSTYGVLMTLVPDGLRGLVFAALIAAVISSLASMMNSISTIFVMDIYRPLIASDRSEKHYVAIGRLTAALALILAVILAKPFIGGMASAFQLIQEYTGFVAPGIVAVFLLGMFWSRFNAQGAFATLFTSIGFNILLKLGFADLAFVVRIWIVFLSCLMVGAAIALITPEPEKDQVVNLSGISFLTEGLFNIGAVVIAVALIGIYAVFW